MSWQDRLVIRNSSIFGQEIAAEVVATMVDTLMELAECDDAPKPVKLRSYGLCAGEFVVPDDFDDPLPSDVLSLFVGASDGLSEELDEFNSWQETMYLLASPANADRLRRSISQMHEGKVVCQELVDL